MKLYTVADEKRTLVCRETAPGTLQVLPYATMNDLLTDDPAHRETILARQTGETLALAEVRVLARLLPGRVSHLSPGRRPAPSHSPGYPQGQNAQGWGRRGRGSGWPAWKSRRRSPFPG